MNLVYKILFGKRFQAILACFALFLISCSHNRIQKGEILIEQKQYVQAIKNLESLRETETYNDQYHYTLAKAYYYTDDLKKARQSIGAALLLNPFNSSHHFLSGRIFFSEKDYFKAGNAFSKAIEFEDSMLEAYYYQSLSFFKSGKKSLALQVLKKAIALDELYFDALVLKARIEFNQAKSEEKLKEISVTLQEILKLNPYDEKANILLAEIFWELGQTFKSVKLLENFVTQKGELTSTAKFKLAEYYYSLGSFLNSLKLIEKSRSFKEKVLWMKIEIENGNFIKVQNELDESLKSNPSSHELYYLQGFIAFQKKEYFYAETALNQAISLKPNYIDARELKSKVLVENQDYQGALIELENILLIKPYDEEVFFKKLKILLQIGRWKEVLRYQNKQFSNLDLQKSLLIQGMLALKQQNYKQAIEVLEKAAKIKYNTEVENQLVASELKAGMILTAEGRLNQLLSLFPEDVEANLNKAKMLYQKKSWDGVIAATKRFLENEKGLGKFHLLLAKSYAQKDQLKKSLKVLRQAHQKWNNDMEIVNQLTLFLGISKKYSEAIKLLKRFSERDHPYKKMLMMRLILFQKRKGLDWKEYFQRLEEV